VPKHETITDLLDTINHECNHIANKVLQYSGVDITYDNDEAHTYLLGYLFEQAFSFFLDNQSEMGLKKQRILIENL
jgi:hypothetical protein